MPAMMKSSVPMTKVASTKPINQPEPRGVTATTGFMAAKLEP
jgi:hypothetical protein